jgi:hypothetical protein
MKGGKQFLPMRKADNFYQKKIKNHPAKILLPEFSSKQIQLLAKTLLHRNSVDFSIDVLANHPLIFD